MKKKEKKKVRPAAKSAPVVNNIINVGGEGLIAGNSADKYVKDMQRSKSGVIAGNSADKYMSGMRRTGMKGYQGAS